MKEKDLAVLASSHVLEKIGEITGVIVKDMIGPVSQALALYGCRKQIAVVEALRVTAPAFETISKQFFEILYQTIEISQKTKQQNFDIILNAIFSDENASIEAKVDLVNKLLAQDGKNNQKIAMTVTTGTVGIVAVAGVASAVKAGINRHAEQAIIKTIEEGKTERVKILMDFMSKFSPVDSIKALGELIHKK